MFLFLSCFCLCCLTHNYIITLFLLWKVPFVRLSVRFLVHESLHKLISGGRSLWLWYRFSLPRSNGCSDCASFFECGYPQAAAVEFPAACASAASTYVSTEIYLFLVAIPPMNEELRTVEAADSADHFHHRLLSLLSLFHAVSASLEFHLIITRNLNVLKCFIIFFKFLVWPFFRTYGMMASLSKNWLELAFLSSLMITLGPCGECGCDANSFCVLNAIWGHP